MDMLASVIVRCEKILKLGIPHRLYIFKGDDTIIVCCAESSFECVQI